MKRIRLLLGLAGAIAAPIAAHADRPANDPSRPYYYSAPILTAQQLQKLNAQMNNVDTTIAEINQSYGTHYMVMDQNEAAAMTHMAQADMEMGTALMELHATLADQVPRRFPTGQ